MTDIAELVTTYFDDYIDEIYNTWSYIDQNGKLLTGCHVHCHLDNNLYSICYNEETDSWCVLTLDEVTEQLDFENQTFQVVYETLHNTIIFFQSIRQREERQVEEEDEQETIRQNQIRNTRANNRAR